jgi:hypothetical protein
MDFTTCVSHVNSLIRITKSYYTKYEYRLHHYEISGTNPVKLQPIIISFKEDDDMFGLYQQGNPIYIESNNSLFSEYATKQEIRLVRQWLEFIKVPSKMELPNLKIRIPDGSTQINIPGAETGCKKPHPKNQEILCYVAS